MSLSKTFELAFVVGAALHANFIKVMKQAQKKTSPLRKAVASLT